MANYEVPENPELNLNIRKLENSDPASATDTFNPLVQQLFTNDVYLNKQIISETQARIESGADMQSQIDIIKGGTIRFYVDFSVEFGSDTPTKDQADSWFANRTPPVTPSVGTALLNSNESQSTYDHRFVYTTDPKDSSALILKDTGKDTATVATTITLGLVRANGDIMVNANGDMYIKSGIIPSAVATTTQNGLMASADKVKLNGIATGATANTKTSTVPKMNGTATVGAETAYASGDHVHPVDTSRAASTHTHSLGNGTTAGFSLNNYTAAEKTKLSGIATGATANTKTSTVPKMNGTAAIGSETNYAVGDHVHPVDTSRAAASHTHVASQITAGTLVAGVIATRSTDYTTARLRNTYFATTKPSSMSNGDICFVYE